MKAEFLARHPEATESWDDEVEALRHEERWYESTLSQLSNACQTTQTEVAAILDVERSVATELERHTELYLRTLQDHIRAIGGELRLVVTFSGEEIDLDLADLAGQAQACPAPETAPAIHDTEGP